jgi:tetratricopeptide (TPR) repeat protein
MKGLFQRVWVGVALLGAGVCLADPVELQDRQQLADGLFRRSLFELAAREYAALAKEPSGVSGMDNVLFRLGECHRRLKRTAEAEAAYKRLIEMFPSSPNVSRAQLQRALMLMEAGGESLNGAVAAFERLVAPEVPADVQAAALYHLGEVLERMNRPTEALARYEQLGTAFADSEYGMYSGLRTAWLLTKTGQPADRRRAMGIYLELSHKAKDVKVVEESLYFAAQVALLDERYEESANLFHSLRTRFPASLRVAEGALGAGWAN